MTQKQKKRSPLKRKPLRNPGESLQEAMQQLLDERAVPALIAAMCAIALAASEWLHWLAAMPPQPKVMSAVAVVAVFWLVCVVAGSKKQMRSLRLGLEGEKAVGQFLEAHRKPGWHVFHDVPAKGFNKGFNVDHILIAPQGVFVIETKTYSKPMRGEAIVEFDGEKLLVSGVEPERNPITQTRAIRDWVQTLLYEGTGIRYPVKGVVVLPGWFVKGSQKQSDIWVLSPKALQSFIEHEPVTVKAEDVALAHSRLSDYVVRETQ
jgi:hypothetical protein